MSNTPRPIQSVSNEELYDRWAKVYDTDGNILQAVDDALLPELLSQLFNSIQTTSSTPSALTVTELGAGTGRNTIKLLAPSSTNNLITHINALDLSPGMLSIARERCTKYLEANATSLSKIPEVNFYEFDALNPANFPTVKENVSGIADIVLSTLVLEHLPISVFFQCVRSLLKKSGGWLVVTNMHAEMGRISQAGFVDDETGEKIRGNSYVYEIEEVVEESQNWGLVVEGKIGERVVREEDVGERRLLGPRGTKWIGVKVWFGVVFRMK